VWTEAIAGPQSLILFALILLLASVYFFVFDAAEPQERQMTAPNIPVRSDFYSALYTLQGQQTYLSHIQTRYAFADELKPLLQEMLNLVPENSARVSSWPQKEEIVTLEPLAPPVQTAGYLYPVIKGEPRAIIIPTEDPQKNLLLEIYTKEYTWVGTS
jgi:hypothetical protein